MSWYRRKPRLKEPIRPPSPYRSSPILDKILEESKKVRPKKPKKE